MFQTTRIPGPAGQAVRMTVRAQRAHCSKCGATEDIPNTGKSSILPPVVISERLRRLGWSIGQTRSKDVCPACVAKTKPAELPFKHVSKDEKLAEFIRDFTPPVADQRENETMSETIQEPKTTGKAKSKGNSASGKPRSHLTFIQRVSLMDAIKVVIEPVSEGVCRYIGGHSDKTVAAGMPFLCNETNVAFVRGEVFGDLRPVAAAGSPEALEERVSELESKVAKLMKIIMDLDPEAYAKAV
jgi:hypothetical protein